MTKHPEDVPLFGGVAGASLCVDEFEIFKGLWLRKTYAHVMSPYVLAFRPPEHPNQAHPAPWKASGGVSFDVEIEIALEEGARPTRFDRLNTLWWTLAMLRLSTAAALRMPVVSDMSFGNVAESSNEPVLWPFEMLPQQIATVANPPSIIEEEHLVWVRKALGSGVKLMDDKAFGRAFQTFDGAIWATSAGSAIVAIWASLETLMKPGRDQITKRLTSSLATLLEPPGAQRDRLFQKLKSLYEARSNSAHASRMPETKELMASFDVARRTFTTCISEGNLPQAETLQNRWRKKT